LAAAPAGLLFVSFCSGLGLGSIAALLFFFVLGVRVLALLPSVLLAGRMSLVY
jgi:hypothetical protein